jgi:hypothetical protein
MKRYSASLAIMELQIKIIVKCHYAHNRMDKIKIITAPNAGEDAEKLYHSYIAGSNVKGISHTKKVSQFALKNKHRTTNTNYWAFIQGKYKSVSI